MVPYFHDPYVVLLSICIAIIGCLTGMATIWNVEASSRGNSASTAPIYRGGAIIGGTIWSMHFIAMNAVRAPVAISYEVLTTALSLGLAMAVTTAGLYLANSSRGWALIAAGGAIMGLGVAGMHYLGMAAMRGCSVHYELGVVAVSIFIGVAASTVALLFSLRRRSLFLTVIGSVVMGFAICSLHYTAMAATSFYPPDLAESFSLLTVHAGILAYIVVAIAGLTCSVVLGAMAEGKI